MAKLALYVLVALSLSFAKPAVASESAKNEKSAPTFVEQLQEREANVKAKMDWLSISKNSGVRAGLADLERSKKDYDLQKAKLLAGGAPKTSADQAKLDKAFGMIETHSNRLFVKALYHSHLKREPDPEGFDFWLGKLESKELKAEEVESYIANSPEAKIRQMYVTHLGREPDAAGLNHWMDLNKRGTSLMEIEKGVKRSAEATKRAAGSGTTGSSAAAK